VLFLPVFVVEVLVLSMFVEALVCSVLCAVFISLFSVTCIMGVYSCLNAMSNINIVVITVFCNLLFFY
jgi:hypothetical protein